MRAKTARDLSRQRTSRRRTHWLNRNPFAVQQRPDDVLVGELLVLLVLGDVLQRQVELAPRSASCRSPSRNSSVTFSASGRGSFASRSARPPARAILSCTSWLVQQVQRHRQAGLVDALALAGADALRPAGHVEEVRRERLVRQHDRPVRGELVARQAGERSSGCRSASHTASNSTSAWSRFG